MWHWASSHTHPAQNMHDPYTLSRVPNNIEPAHASMRSINRSIPAQTSILRAATRDPRLALAGLNVAWEYPGQPELDFSLREKGFCNHQRGNNSW